MTIKQPYAVITQHHSKYTRPRHVAPTQWSVFLVGRETPQRIYRLAEKPPRWTHDAFYPKEHAVIGRFETKDEAEAFIAQAKAYMGAQIEELEAARQAEKDARERVSLATRALNAATTKFWEDRANA